MLKSSDAFGCILLLPSNRLRKAVLQTCHWAKKGFQYVSDIKLSSVTSPQNKYFWHSDKWRLKRKHVQPAFIKRWLDVEHYNMGKKRLHVHHLFSFLHARKSKCLHRQTLSLSPLLLLATCHFCSIKICISKWSSKDDGHARADGSCSSHLPLFCFTTTGKTTLLPEGFIIWNRVHDDIGTHLFSDTSDLNIVTSLVFR